MSAAAAAVMTFVLTAGPVIIDVPGKNVRDCAPPLRDADGVWHLYATVINASKGEPGYYGEVGHFSARGDNASALSKPWTYHGIVVERSADPSAWDSTGVFTPGVIFDQGEWTLFFGGVGAGFRNHSGGWFSEYLGAATSSSPYGPFVKSAANPIVRSAIGPPPLGAVREQCNLKRLPAGTNLKGRDIASVPLKSEDECAARCCETARCAAYTFTSFQDNAGPGALCERGQPCCWLKDAVGPSSPKDNCSSAEVAQPAPNGSWPFLRVDNPLPLIAADGTRLLLVKAVAANMTAFLNVYLPHGGSGASFAPPYEERPGNPINHATEASPDGFENQEVFRGPDGLLHMIGNNHGPAGNPHLVSSPTGGLVRWEPVELLHGLGEPAPLAAGVPGAGAAEPIGFVRFGNYAPGRLAVRFESIEWRPMAE